MNEVEQSLKDNPLVILNQNEFNVFLLKFGSLLFLLNNKNINPAFLFLSLVKEDKLQVIFKEISGIPTLQETLKIILNHYPNMVKSKIVRENSIKILKNKENKIKRTVRNLEIKKKRKTKKNNVI